MAALPLATVSAIFIGLLLGVSAVTLGRRADSSRGWGAVGLVAFALVVSGYGLLHRLLCAGGPRCGPSASADALIGGGVAVIGAVSYLVVLARR